MKRVLVTGSNGFVGSNIIKHITDNIEIYGLNQSEKSNDIKMYNCDITDFTEVEKIIKDNFYPMEECLKICVEFK